MKKLAIILICILVALAACTKSKEVHPEMGDGNDEIITVGMKDVNVKYMRTDHAELSRVVFHYGLSDATIDDQQFQNAEMTRNETCFELSIDSLMEDRLYSYYYELFPVYGHAFNTEKKTFHTQAKNKGALTGLFSVAEDNWVRFSKGNLQYQASTNTWRFADYQWCFVGGKDYITGNEFGNIYENGNMCSNDSASESYGGWIDLFGYGTSGWYNGAVCYQPWARCDHYTDYYIGGTDENQLVGSYSQADWGVYNAISNGGNSPGLWRTLTCQEWEYLLRHRSNADMKCALAVVNGCKGCVLLPDMFVLPETCSFASGFEEGFETNNYSLSQWRDMEYAGAVFLPSAGYCSANVYRSIGGCVGNNYGNVAYYWLSTREFYGASGVSMAFFGIKQCDCDYDVSWHNGLKWFCCSVRLVQDDNP